jgi:hypothetical protein
MAILAKQTNPYERVDKKIEDLSEKYRLSFRENTFEYQRLFREYCSLKFYNVIKKIKISRQMKKVKKEMDFAERKYNLLRPSVN